MSPVHPRDRQETDDFQHLQSRVKGRRRDFRTPEYVVSDPLSPTVLSRPGFVWVGRVLTETGRSPVTPWGVGRVEERLEVGEWVKDRDETGDWKNV